MPDFQRCSSEECSNSNHNGYNSNFYHTINQCRFKLLRIHIIVYLSTNQIQQQAQLPRKHTRDYPREHRHYHSKQSKWPSIQCILEELAIDWPSLGFGFGLGTIGLALGGWSTVSGWWGDIGHLAELCAEGLVVELRDAFGFVATHDVYIWVFFEKYYNSKWVSSEVIG